MKRLLLSLLLLLPLACAPSGLAQPRRGGALLSAAHRRNAGAFTPLSIAGCQLWLDANQITPGYVDGDPLSTWNDLSTHAHDFTQSGGARPIYKTNIQNGLPAILFSASTYMTCTLSVSQAMTVFIVIKHNGTGTNYQFIMDGASNRIALVRLSAVSQGYDLFAGSDAIVARSDDTSWHVLGGVANSTSSIVSIDGTETTGLDAGTNSLGSTTYLSSEGAAPGTLGVEGYIGTVIIYDTALSSGNRTLLVNYLKAEYGL